MRSSALRSNSAPGLMVAGITSASRRILSPQPEDSTASTTNLVGLSLTCAFSSAFRWSSTSVDASMVLSMAPSISSERLSVGTTPASPKVSSIMPWRPMVSSKTRFASALMASLSMPGPRSAESDMPVTTSTLTWRATMFFTRKPAALLSAALRARLAAESAILLDSTMIEWDAMIWSTSCTKSSMRWSTRVRWASVSGMPPVVFMARYIA